MADFITSRDLGGLKSPVGNGVGGAVPSNNSTEIIKTKSADTTNSNSGTGLNEGYNKENLSAKWKNGAQDVNPAGKGQYE